MSGTTYRVMGNLALQPSFGERPHPDRPSGSSRAVRFSVIEGSGARVEGSPVVERLARVPRSIIMFIAVMLPVCCIVLAFLSFAVRGAAVDAAISSTPRVPIATEEGDSLWDIAQSHPIEGLSTQETVDAIMSWNGLSTAELHPGEELLVASR